MSFGNKKFTFLNQKDAQLHEESFENTAFYWGKSIFTTGLITQGKLAFFDEHEKRLQDAFQWLFGNKKILRLEEILSPTIAEAIYKLEDKASLKIRITLFENMSGEVQELVQVGPYQKSYDETLVVETVASPVLSLSRPSFVKLGSYAETLRQREIMIKEPIFFDSENCLMEGAVANLVLFDDINGIWVTPESQFTIVEGLGLKVGLKKLKVERKRIKKNQLDQFSAAFFVNCLKGVCPISSIDGREFIENHFYQEELQSTFDRSCKETGRLVWQMEK